MSLSCGKILSATELERYRVHLERNLPVKGKKEFAPSGSWVECKQLDAARDERHALLKEERVERVGALSVAEWDEKMSVAVVTFSVGKHWETFGHQREQIMCLNPEEALFLLETTNLLLLHNNVGLSVQQGYNTLLGQRTGCPLDCYRVFSHLVRQGFRLKRHDGPLFVLTDYERRIGLQSYLYPSRHTVVNTQEPRNTDSENGDHFQSNEREANTSSQNSGDETASTSVKEEHPDVSSEGQIKIESHIPATSDTRHSTSLDDMVSNNTIKSEHTVPEITSTSESSICDVLPNNTGNSVNVSSSNAKRMGQDVSSKPVRDGICSSHQKAGTIPEIQQNETACDNTIARNNIHHIKHEQDIETSSFESASNEGSNSAYKLIVSDAEMKMENGSQRDTVKIEEGVFSEIASTDSSSQYIIKKETDVMQDTPISVESADSCDVIDSLDKVQNSNKHLHNSELQPLEFSENQYTKKENLQMVHEVCLISDSSVSECSDIVEHEDHVEKVSPHITHSNHVGKLTVPNGSKLHAFHRKTRRSNETIVIDQTSETVNLKTVSGEQSSCNNSLKHEIDISSTEESMDACSNVNNSKDKADIYCLRHKRRGKRKRTVSHRKTSIKSEKSYVVDVETGTIMKSDGNLLPEKAAKRECDRNISEIIVVDDTDGPNRNDVTVNLRDDELELELTKFYEEITLVDLTVEDTSTQTRDEILELFPNFAGVKAATVRAPPPDLLPENVTPSQQEYQIDLQNMLADRPSWIVRRHHYRGRGNHHRFHSRRGYHRRPAYNGSIRQHVRGERTYVDSPSTSEEFPHNVVMGHERQSVGWNYNNASQQQDHMPLAVIDTSGDNIRRLEHQHRYSPRMSNKQWYDRTWTSGSQNDTIMQYSDSQQYEHQAVDDRYTKHQYNHQRWNRRYSRNTHNWRRPSNRPKFRSSHYPASKTQQQTRSASFQEETTEYNWQNIRNVAVNAENWLELKKLLNHRNSQEFEMKDEPESLLRAEEDNNEDNGLLVEPMDDEPEEEEVEWKPLIQPTDCTDVGSILTKLRIFKEVPFNSLQVPHIETRLKINYDVYLPTTKFKKSSPCLPDYRLCIAGCEDGVPSAGEVAFLLKDLQDDVPLLFAVVVPDSVAFYHFANISLPVDDSCPV